MTKQEALLGQFTKAVARLEESLALPLSASMVERDSSIKRFEICFDLGWKTVKEKLGRDGIECYSPKSCFQEAFRAGMIAVADEPSWNDLIQDRNKSVHVYSETMADEIYKNLPNYVVVFKKIIQVFQNKNESF